MLGRLASEVAKILRGKHKPIFAPHADTGDHVIVLNARGVRLTGGKELQKVQYHHSGYPGGLRRVGYARLMAQRPATMVEKAVRGMLPKNRLGRQMLTKLAVYEGGEHPHQAQKPTALGLGEIPRWEGLPAPKAPPAPKAVQEPAKKTTGKRITPAASSVDRSTSGPRAKSATATRGTRKPSGTSAKPSTSSRPGSPKAPSGGVEGSTPRTRRARTKAPSHTAEGGSTRRSKKTKES